MKETLAKANKDYEDLSKALAKKEDDEDDELPDGMLRLGKGGPIVPEKLFRKHPILAALFQNFGPMLGKIKPDDIAGLVSGFSAYVQKTNGVLPDSDEEDDDENNEAEEVVSHNERQNQAERDHQKLQKERIRLDREAADAADAKAKALARLKRQQAQNVTADQAGETANGSGAASHVGSRETHDPSEAASGDEPQPTAPPQRRATAADGAFIPTD